jgi:hypothetical protein
MGEHSSRGHLWKYYPSTQRFLKDQQQIDMESPLIDFTLLLFDVTRD